MKINSRKLALLMQPKDVYELLSDSFNGNNLAGGKAGVKEFANFLNDDHRTLQQLFVKFFWNVLVEYGKTHQNEFSYDARNEQAVKLCRILAELDEKHGFSFPLI